MAKLRKGSVEKLILLIWSGELIDFLGLPPTPLRLGRPRLFLEEQKLLGEEAREEKLESV